MQVEQASSNTPEPTASSEPNYFPNGVFIPKHLTPSKIHLEALDKLMAGLTKTVRLEKLHHKPELYSLRASKGARIIGVSEAGKFMVVALYDNHQYQRLKLINAAGLNNRIDLDEPSEETAGIHQALKRLDSEDSSYWRKGHFINRKAIYFSDLQEEIINNNHLPIIVSGAAGSGKTLIIIKMLVNDWLSGNHRTAYIAPTSNLAQHAQRLFEEQIAQLDTDAPQERPNTKFFSIQQFIETHKAHGKELAGQEFVIKWLKTNHTKVRFQRKVLAQPEKVFEEFKIISVLANRSMYLKRGREQSLYTNTEDRNACFTLYEQFVKQFPNQCQLAFPALEHNEPTYDKVIIDEGQAFTIKQLYEMTQCAVNGQFLVFGDPLQNFHNKISVFPQLKQHLCERYHLQDPVMVLSTTYRNPAPVMHFANDILRIRRLLLCGIDDKCETVTLLPPPGDASDPYPVEWLQKIDEDKRKELAVLLNQPNTMVITGNEKSRVKADQLFDSPAILFAEHAQGLEAQTVLLYCLFTPELIRQINKHLQGANLNEDRVHMPKSGQGTNEFTCDLNRLFTAVTRVAEAKGRLIVYMGDNIAKHDSELFFSLLTKSIQAKTIPEVKAEPATEEQWKKWVKDLYDSGNTGEARKIFCKHIKTDEQEYNLLVGKPPVVPAEPEKLVRPVQKAKQNNKQPVPPRKPQAQPVQPVATTTAPVSVLQTATMLALAEREITYLNGLLKNFHVNNVISLLKNRRAAHFLLTPFLKDNQQTTLYSEIVTYDTLINVFINAVLSDPFLATGKLLESGAIITTLTAAIGSIFRQQTSKHHKNIEILRSKSRVELLHLLITNQPDLIEHIPQRDFWVSLFDVLIAFDHPLLLKIIDRAPELIETMIDYFLNTNSQLEWYIFLMKTRVGAATLVRMYEINPKVLELFKEEALNNYTKQSFAQPTPLYFWLSTTIKGMLLLKEILPKNQLTQQSLHQPVQTNDAWFNGTTTDFWISAFNASRIEQDPLARAKQLSIPYELNQFTFADAFKTGKKEAALIQFDYESAPKNKILEKLDTLFRSNNAPRLLFDYVNGAEKTMMFRIAKHPDLADAFIEILNQRPDNYKVFTIDRLNQQLVFQNSQGDYCTQSILFICIAAYPEFLANLFTHSPDIKDFFTAGLLLKPGYLGKDKVNILQTLYVEKNHISQLLLLGPKVFTPEFAAALFEIGNDIDIFNLDSMQYSKNFKFNSMRYVSEELAFQLIQKYPQLLNYFTAKHLYMRLFMNRATPERPLPTMFHSLCKSPACLSMLDMLINKNPDILNDLTLDDLVAKPTLLSSIMLLLCQSSKGYLMLLKIFHARPNLFKQIVFSHLMEAVLEEGAIVYLYQYLFYWADVDTPELLQFLVKNPPYVQSIDPEILLSKATVTIHKLCNSREGLTVLEDICRQHPVILEKLTKEMFYKPGTCRTNSMFESLYNLYKTDIFNGKETLLNTLFRLNPAIINFPKNNQSGYPEQFAMAVQIQFNYLKNPGFFSSGSRMEEQVAETQVQETCPEM